MVSAYPYRYNSVHDCNVVDISGYPQLMVSAYPYRYNSVHDCNVVDITSYRDTASKAARYLAT